MIQGVFSEITQQVREGLSAHEIEEHHELTIPLFQFAVLNNLDEVIDTMIGRDDADFNQCNVAGETIAHHIAETNDARALHRLSQWVAAGLVDPTVQTKILSNFLHYATHITEPNRLAICFSMASVDMVLAQNQLGKSPLSLAIEQDNADFLRAAFKAFPQLISLKQTLSGFATLCDWLLHDIARTGANKCFAVLHEHFTESVWSDLQAYRNQGDERPIDSAALAGQRTLFQMLKGYRAPNGAPTLQWLSAVAIAQSTVPAFLTSCQQMLGDAMDEVQAMQVDEEPSSVDSDYEPTYERYQLGSR